MSSDPPPLDPVESERPPIEAVVPSQRRRAIAVITACAILALPLGYLLLHHGQEKTSVAASGPEAPSTAALEALVQTQPTSANRINLSLAYINGGTPERAIPLLEGVVATDKTNTVAWNNLCVAHTMRQDYATAIDECNNALLISPDFQLARNNLKWASDEKNKTIDAIHAADTSSLPHDGAFYLALGLNQLHVGDYDQAIASWQKTLQLDPKSAAAANNVGIAYMMKKHPDDAIVWFNNALALDPTMQLAKNNLAWARDEQAKAGR